jgi:hypothetical protein
LQSFPDETSLFEEHFKVGSPRKYIPKRENIYSTLKSRLQSTNSLLDFGEVEVPSTPFSTFLSKQLEKRRNKDTQCVFSNGPRTLKVENLGTLPRQDEFHVDAEHDKEVLELLDKFQEANFVASGKKGFCGHCEKHEWRHTTFV